MDQKAIDQLDCMIFSSIDVPSVLEVFLVVLEIEKETLLLVIKYCMPGFLVRSLMKIEF